MAYLVKGLGLADLIGEVRRTLDDDPTADPDGSEPAADTSSPERPS